MGELRNISNEIVTVSIGVIGLILIIGVAVAGVEAQINHLLGKPASTNYGGKLMLLTFILGIAAISISISNGVAHALGF